MFTLPTGRPLSHPYVARLLRELQIDVVPRGFRSRFRDWVVEGTKTRVRFAGSPWRTSTATVSRPRADLFETRRTLPQQRFDYMDAQALGVPPIRIGPRRCSCKKVSHLVDAQRSRASCCSSCSHPDCRSPWSNGQLCGAFDEDGKVDAVANAVRPQNDRFIAVHRLHRLHPQR